MALVDAIRADLRAAADPSRAPQMQAYVKSAMPFLGVRVREVRTVVRRRIRTDPPATADALAAVVRALRHEADFFLRKAIGWALRDYARTDAGWVRGFVDTHPVSPLSRREALKRIG